MQNEKGSGPLLSLLHEHRANSRSLIHIVPIASSFWSDFSKWYHSVSKKTLSLSKNEIIYGVLTNWSSCSTLNHLILRGKYFLYCKSLNNAKFQFADFLNLVYDKIEIECNIASISNKQNMFLEKWSSFIN